MPNDKISEAVAAGKFPGGSLVAEGDGAAVADPTFGDSAATPDDAAVSPPRPPLRVRVQALPKVCFAETWRTVEIRRGRLWGRHGMNLARLVCSCVTCNAEILTVSIS